MDITTRIDINLTPEDVKEIIQQFLIKKGYDVNEVYFDVFEECTGYGAGETYTPKFRGVKATCKKVLED